MYNKENLRLNIVKVAHLAHQLGIPEEHLNYLANNSQRYFYEEDKIGKNGKVRHIEPSVSELKRIQQILNERILRRSINALPDYFHGSRPRHSAIDNAIPHLRKDVVFKADLKDFFPNISNRTVYKTIQKLLNCSPDVARIITKIVTYKGHVPQGAPTSSSISALVLLPAADRMKQMADKYGWAFTVYVDDLTFSGDLRIPRFKSTIERIAREHGFIPNPKKSIAMPSDKEQVVTGLKVNGSKPSITQSFRDEVFRGLAEVKQFANIHAINPKIIFSLLGKIRFIKGIDGALYKSIMEQREVRVMRSIESRISRQRSIEIANKGGNKGAGVGGGKQRGNKGDRRGNKGDRPL